MNLCISCQHCLTQGSEDTPTMWKYVCRKYLEWNISPVTGLDHQPKNVSCVLARRHGGFCGPNGKYYVAREGSQ